MNHNNTKCSICDKYLNKDDVVVYSELRKVTKVHSNGFYIDTSSINPSIKIIINHLQCLQARPEDSNWNELED